MNRVIPLYWHRSINFGDQIAPYLVEKITGLKAALVNPWENQEHACILGSIIEDCNEHSIIWGAGTAHGTHPPKKYKEVRAFRGDLTEKWATGGVSGMANGDPALLLPRFYQPNVEKRYAVGIIPHLVDYEGCLLAYHNLYPDYTIIDLRKPVEEVIDLINECEMTICSSLHGLIVSHAYGIPSRWVEFSDKVIGSGFKFRDYFTTVSTINDPLDLRGFPNILSIREYIGGHEITTDLDKLLESCPL